MGLRFLHYSVTLFQLVITGIMAALRVWIRRNMIHEPYHREIMENYELESAAKLISGCEVWNVVSRAFEDEKLISTTRIASNILEARRKLGSSRDGPGRATL